MAGQPQVIFDESGHPFIIMRDQGKQARMKGLEAHKSNILAARAICDILKTSLGPKGMDKMLVSQDGDVTVTNDGATILEKLNVEHQIGRLLVELSKSQDDEIGDGTTGVVVLAGALLEQAEKLLSKKVHPLTLSKGFEKACDICVNKLNSISDTINFTRSDRGALIKVAKTTLNSKIINKCLDLMATVAVDAVLKVADFDKKDVNFDLIKVIGKVGGKLDETCLINGIVIDKTFSHPQMPEEVRNPKIAVLTCPFEPPKPKTKNQLDIKTVENYNELRDYEQRQFVEMVKACKSSGATVVACQWGFDDEANHLLLQEELPAIRWIGGCELELLAMAINARIVPRFQDLNEKKLGTCGIIRTIKFGTSDDKMLAIEDCKAQSNTCTILVRGGNKMILEETKRSLHDAMCVTRNLIRDNRIVYGGGSAEVACAMTVREHVFKLDSPMEQLSFEAFAEALETIPRELANNSGLSPLHELAELKEEQTKKDNPNLGIDCMQRGTRDMKSQNVFETLIGKQQQLLLATQLVKMILKIDDVILPTEKF